jgi:acyl carrier protein
MMNGGGEMTVTIDEVMDLVRIQLGVSTVRPTDRLVEDLDAESADLLNIIAAAEDRYGTAVSEEELATISTVSEIFELIRRRVEESD